MPPKQHFLQAVEQLQGNSCCPFVNCAAFHHKGFTFFAFSHSLKGILNSDYAKGKAARIKRVEEISAQVAEHHI